MSLLSRLVRPYWREGAIICAALDSLTKGASGPVVQSMNLMLGFPETTGLEARAVFP